MPNYDLIFVVFGLAFAFFIVYVIGANNAQSDYERKLAGVGIEKIKNHYAETDGVRTNWYEIIWKSEIIKQ